VDPKHVFIDVGTDGMPGKGRACVAEFRTFLLGHGGEATVFGIELDCRSWAYVQSSHPPHQIECGDLSSQITG